jgi:hypothetical protein
VCGGVSLGGSGDGGGGGEGDFGRLGWVVYGFASSGVTDVGAILRRIGAISVALELDPVAVAPN